MPKTIKELKTFKEGLFSNASTLDIPDEAAAYSENINPETEGGTLGGIPKDKVLDSSGFVSATTNQIYLDILPGYDDLADDAARKTAYNNSVMGYPNASYFIFQMQEGIRSFVVQLDTDTLSGVSASIDYLGDHTIETQDGLVSLIDIAPDIGGAAVTAMVLNMYIEDTGSNYGANFTTNVINKFVSSWNALQYKINPNDATDVRTMSGIILATADVSGSNRRVILTPQTGVEVNNVIYNQYGNSFRNPSTGDNAGGDGFGPQIDQIKEVKNDKRQATWSSGTSDGFTAFELEGTNSAAGLIYTGTAARIRNHSTIPDGYYLLTGNSGDIYDIRGDYASDGTTYSTVAASNLIRNGDFSEVAETDSSQGDGLEGWDSWNNHHTTNNHFKIQTGDNPNQCRMYDNGTNALCAIAQTGVLEKDVMYKYTIKIDDWTDSDAGNTAELWFVTTDNAEITVNDTPVMGEDGNLVKFNSTGDKVGFFKATGTNFVITRKDRSSGSDTITADFSGVSITRAGTLEIAEHAPPFSISTGVEGTGLEVKASDLSLIYDGHKTDLITFDKNTNSIHKLDDIDNDIDFNNGVGLVKSGLSHDNTSSFIRHNKEVRLGLGPGKASIPYWCGSIERKQLENDHNGFFVEPQELVKPAEELTGYNFDKFIVPYLPPADEMGKRWYQSQLIDMKNVSQGTGTTTGTDDGNDIPAYQCALEENNLGAVNFGSVNNDTLLKACFDVGASSSAANQVTAALNNVAAGGTSAATSLVRPFTGLTFVLSHVNDFDGILRDAKRRYWKEDATIAIGDVYMVTKLTYATNNTCSGVDFLYMGNVNQGTSSGAADGIGAGPAFGIGLSYGQKILSYVSLWPNPGGTASTANSSLKTFSIPINDMLDSEMDGEITAINWCHSYMTHSETTEGTPIKRKINKKYGTITYALNSSNKILRRFDLHNVLNDTSTDHGPQFPKKSQEFPSFRLNFGKFPNSLTTEGKKIVDPPYWDSEDWQDEWEREPKDSVITDIMDTWNRRDADADGSGFLYRDNTSDGDIVGSYEPNGSYLTWIMYGKNSDVASYNRWDMFLYNFEASGSTYADEKVWLDPNRTGDVYVKDRTPPYTECNKHSRNDQKYESTNDFYYNRERFGVSSLDSSNIAGNGFPSYYGFYSNGKTSKSRGRWLTWRHNKNTSGADDETSWVLSSSMNNDTSPENDVDLGKNIGWYSQATRQIKVNRGTLTRYEPRFEVVRQGQPGDNPVVAHNQGHRVMFAGHVTGTFIESGGRLKPAEGYYNGLFWLSADHEWWCTRDADKGVTKTYTDSLELFTIKEISCKTYEHPEDMYGSGGERELGVMSFGGSGAANHTITANQLSQDVQNSHSSSDHTREDGDYIYINRLFRLEKNVDYHAGHNDNVHPYPYATSRGVTGNTDRRYNCGNSVTSIVYNGEGDATNGDYTSSSSVLTAVNSGTLDRMVQDNTMYQIDPLISMNTISNGTDTHSLGVIYGMEPLLIWDGNGATNQESQFKRILVIYGQAFPAHDDEADKTFIGTYNINKHHTYSTENSTTHIPGNVSVSNQGELDYNNTVGAFENSLKGTNLVNTAAAKASMGFGLGSISSPTVWKNSYKAEIDSIKCLAARTYENPRLLFSNTTLHLQGYEESSTTDDGIFGTGTYNPAIVGISEDKTTSILTHVKDAINVFQLTQSHTAFDTLGAVVTSTNNDLGTSIDTIDNLIKFDMTGSSAGAGFSSGDIINYKISLLYDGIQESPLSTFTIKSPQLSEDKSNIAATFKVTNTKAMMLSPRVSHINLYFSDDLVTKPWTFAESINLDTTSETKWNYNNTDNKWEYSFSHTPSGPTYETMNGISSNRRHTMVNWGLSTKLANYTVYGQVSHRKISDNIENYLYRSKPGRPDVVDWVNDFLILPTKPIAIQGFKGKLYAWDKNDTYIINQEGFYVEDVLEGIGILGKDAVVATDFGMCFADANNIYIHNGVSATPIGEPILRNSLKRRWRVGYINAVDIAESQGYDIKVLYDGRHNSFIVTTKGFCKATACTTDEAKRGARAFSFSISKQRWDYIEVPSVLAFAQGAKNRIYLADGFNIFEHKRLREEARDWEWYSKNMSFGSDTQLKVFNKLKLAGRPSGLANTNIKAYVDGEEKTLTIENKNYNTSITSHNLNEANATPTSLDTTNPATWTYKCTDDEGTYTAAIRQGMYVKLEDEIMYVSAESMDYSTGLLTLTLQRGQLGTTNAAHSGAKTFYVLGPSYKFPSGTKGYKMRFELDGQKGMVDSVAIIYRAKGLK